jgi:hypothetical protein
VLRDLALLDRRLFGLGVPLLGCRHDRGIDDLPAHREIATLGERSIEAGEQPLDRLGLHQPLTEQPDRRCVRYRAIKPDTQEPLERQPILDLELARLVRQRVKRLQHQDLEHHHRIERRPAALAANTAPKRCHQRTTENLEVDDSRQALERITRCAQRLVPVRKIKETRLSRHACLRCRAKVVNQFKPLRASGFSRCPFVTRECAT